MTITSRGAVAPTADQAGTAGRRPGGCGRPLDTAALDAVVNQVADHASAWAKTDAAARADLLHAGDRRHHGGRGGLAGGGLRGQGPGAAARPRRARSSSQASGRSCAWRACSATRCATSRRMASPPSPARSARRPTAGCGCRSSRTAPSTGSRSPRRPPRSGCSPASPGSRSSQGQAAAYADPAAHAGTALVLAAGNVASLGPRDALSKLFVEGKVVVMKANPVNDYLVPHWSRALASLIDAGVLRIVDGGAAVGQYLTAHALIDEVHITGSDKTYDAVVFGTGPDGVRRKAADEPGAGQAGDGRAGQRVTGDRGAGQVVDRRTALPGRARGHHAGQQRGLQLHLGPGSSSRTPPGPSATPSSAR